MRAKRGEQQGGVHVDMTPMVDIMMLLIIFFIMSTTFIVHSGFNVNLPSAAAEKQRREQIDVIINREGAVAVNGQTVTKPEIPAAIGRSGADPSTVVVVRADKAVSHGQVVEVMDAVRKAGFAKISIAVEPKG